jgi:anthranilate phosphoribosyltransferase
VIFIITRESNGNEGKGYNSINIKHMLKRLVDMKDLNYYEAKSSINALFFDDKISDAFKAAFLTALSMKGESIEELRAVLDFMLENAVRIHVNTTSRVIDTCGTGGDNVKTFNVSTLAAFIASACGVYVAKHGNRAVSSVMGSADLLEHLGYDLDTDAIRIKECIESIGIGFLFAPKFHPIMKRISSIRKELGIRTVFNLVGPLSNPVNINAQIVGVSSPALLKKIAYILKDLREEVMVFHAVDGMDELSNTCINKVVHVKGNEVKEHDLDPKSIGFEYASIKDLSVNTKDDAVRIFLDAINGNAKSAVEDIAVLNASAALIIGDKADRFSDAIDNARSAVKSGKAYGKLRDLIAMCGDIDRLRELEEMYRLN